MTPYDINVIVNIMAELPLATPGAVAIIETPEHFIAEGRPDIPGGLAYSGRIQLFGGHVEEEPGETIRRELSEELGLRLDETPPSVWSGVVPSQNRRGELVRRHVSLFRVAIEPTVALRLKVPGTIIRIPKTVEGVEAYREQLTPFAFRALYKAVTGEPWEE